MPQKATCEELKQRIRVLEQSLSEREHADKELRYRIELEKCIAAISTRFIGISSDRIDAEINRTLQILGQLTHVDRSYLFLISDDGAVMDNTHEWCARGIEPQMENLQGIQIAAFPWWTEKLNGNEAIHIPRVDDLPAAAGAEKALCRSQAIRSLLAVPLTRGQRPVGFIGFDAVRAGKTWSQADIALLRTIGDIIANKLETRRVETKLSQSKKFLDSVINSIADPVFVKDERHRWIVVNDALCRMFGFSRAEMLGKSDYDFFPGREADVFWAHDNMVMASGRVDSNEEEITGGGGGYTISTVKAPFTNPTTGRRNLVGTIRDITGLKRAEAALRASETKYRHIFENAQIGLCRTRISDGLVLEANQRLVEMLGFDSRDAFIERIFVGDLYADPEIKTRVIAELKDRGEIKNCETRFKRKDGSVRWFRFSGRIYEEEGYFEGVVADITESKQTAKEKVRLEEQYRQAQKVEAIGRLAGGVAHDLNNLLTPILGYGEMLLGDFSSEDSRRQSIEQIVRAGYLTRNLVHQLLAFSRKQTLKYQSLNLNRTIEGFRNLLRRTIREDIEINIVPMPGIRTIEADIGQIEQVLMNLSVNAQDAMADGGRLTIETTMVEIQGKDTVAHPGIQKGRYVMLLVSDTGCGMDEQTQKLIFEPFFSTKGDQGTGLGLATVYGIVKQHGGSIQVCSQPGNGTTFEIYLPVSEEAHFHESGRGKPAKNLRGCETIVLVEDNEQVRDLGHVILTRQGYTVLLAENAAGALTSLASHDGPVHLLLTDVIMPGMNGKELFSRAAETRPDLKVLYMSGYSDNVIAQHGILDEGVQFLQKPFTGHGLVTKVQEVLTQD